MTLKLFALFLQYVQQPVLPELSVRGPMLDLIYCCAASPDTELNSDAKHEMLYLLNTICFKLYHEEPMVNLFFDNSRVSCVSPSTNDLISSPVRR